MLRNPLLQWMVCISLGQPGTISPSQHCLYIQPLRPCHLVRFGSQRVGQIKPSPPSWLKRRKMDRRNPTFPEIFCLTICGIITYCIKCIDFRRLLREGAGSYWSRRFLSTLVHSRSSIIGQNQHLHNIFKLKYKWWEQTECRASPATRQSERSASSGSKCQVIREQQWGAEDRAVCVTWLSLHILR